MALREPNFTQVPHEIIDTYMRDLSECELKALLFLLRNTRGFQRKRVTVSLATISEATGIDKGALCRGMQRLEELDLVIKNKNSSDDGGCSASTYEVNWEGHPPVAVRQHPVAGEQHPPLLGSNGIRNIENNLIEKNILPPPTPPSNENQTDHPQDSYSLNLDDRIEVFVKNCSSRERGPKIKLSSKASMAIVDRLVEREREIGNTALRIAWTNYLRSGDWRKIEHPLPYFLACPMRWACRVEYSAPPVEPPEIEASVPAPQRAAPVLPFPPPRDFIAEWNARPSLPRLDWDSRNSPVEALRECSADQEFHKHYTEVLDLSEKIHEARDSDVSWLTFAFVIRKKKGEARGWWRVLNEFRGMAEPQKTRLERMMDRI